MRMDADMRMRPSPGRIRPGVRPGRFLGRIRKAHVLSLGFVFAALALVLLVRAFFVPDRFPVRVVRVVGDLQNIPRPLLVAAVEPLLHQNFYGLDLSDVKKTIAAIPWVGVVRVERQFPRILRISISPARLVARWGLGGFVAAQAAHVHLGGYHVPGDLPLFSGPPQSEADMVAHYHRFSQTLKPLGLSVASLTLSSRQTWRVALKNGPLLVLGHAATARLVRFGDIFPEISGQIPSMRRIDLRYTNGFAVSWRKASGDHNE